jgi:hypothetical protein
MLPQSLTPHGPLTHAHLGATSRLDDPAGILTRAIPKGAYVSLIVGGITYQIPRKPPVRSAHDFSVDAASFLFDEPEHRMCATEWLTSITKWSGVGVDMLPEDTRIKVRQDLELSLNRVEPEGEIVAYLTAPGGAATCSASRVIPDDSARTVVTCVASMLGVTLPTLMSVVRIQGITGAREPKRRDGLGMLLGSPSRFLQVSYIRECGKCGERKKLVRTSTGARVELTLCLPCARTRVRALSGGYYVLTDSNKLEITGAAVEPTGTDAVMISVLLALQRDAGSECASPFARLLAEMPRFADLVAKNVLYNSEWSKFRAMCGLKRKLMECKAKLQPLEGTGFTDFVSDMRRLVASKGTPADMFEAADDHLRKRARLGPVFKN